MMNLDRVHFWAKTLPDGQPGISVRDHCLNVGCVAEALIAALPESLRQLLPPGAVTLTALHDIGKISPGFQQKSPNWLEKNKVWFSPDAGYHGGHARVSQLFLESVMNGRFRRWAEAVGAHHGRVQGNDMPGAIGGRDWASARHELFKALETEFGSLPEADALRDAAQWLLAGLTSVADWLGSDEQNFSPENLGPLDKTVQQAKAKEIVRRLELAGAELVGDKIFTQVFAGRLKGKSPRPLQQKLIESQKPAPGVYVIEDTMGSGKTEAALWLAYRLITSGQARGLYFGLPTRVTSDRIHRRMKEFLAEVYSGGVAPPLVHGQAWLREMPDVKPAWKERKESNRKKDNDEERPEDQVQAVRQWFASSRCGLLAPFAVGTVDQALLGVIAAKWFFVRQFALAGKVVVLDEVHSYDLYTSTLMAQLVRRLRELHATPVILSATLTAKQRAALLGEPEPADGADAPYPLVTVKTGEAPAQPWRIESQSKPRTVHPQRLVVPSFDEIHDVAMRAVELASEKRCVLWIRNTVGHAQEAYRLINGEKCGDTFEVGLLHSRYPAYQRQSYAKLDLEKLKSKHLHEERWLRMLGEPNEQGFTPDRPRGCVLVSTQVVEQSVDIDADVLITDLAPTDMLLQRLGRLHRHDRGERGPAVVYVVVPQPVAERAAELDESQIKAALGSVGYVYAPYVLLRSWEQWSQPNRDRITLPTDIRTLLEATYADRLEEPHGWQAWLTSLKDKRDNLEKLALSATDVRGQPLQPDAEGLGTRFSNQRQILLLLARSVSSEVDKTGNPAVIQLLNGTLRREQYLKFNLQAAKSLHRNAATIPAWWVPGKTREPLPAGLAQYFSEPVVMAVYDSEHAELILGVKDRGVAPVICYHPINGLWLEKRPAKEAIQSEYDGEDEDGMF